MCIQVKDSILIKGEKYYLYTTPLDSYWSKRNPKPQIRPTKSTCWRGYIATWEIVKDNLYLVDIIFHAHDGGFGLDYLFPNNTGKIKADWYTGEVKIPIGNKLYQEFMEDPVYDSDWFISIEHGNVLSQRYLANH
jgi:hypothetical protein